MLDDSNHDLGTPNYGLWKIVILGALSLSLKVEDNSYQKVMKT